MGVGKGTDPGITPEGASGSAGLSTRRARTTARLAGVRCEVGTGALDGSRWQVGAPVAGGVLVVYVIVLAALGELSAGAIVGLTIAQAAILAVTVVASHRVFRLRHQLFSSRRLGDYRLVAPLGGGMSEVWLAWDEPHRREVALKLLRTTGTPEATRARFAREVELVRSLRTPQVTRIYDFGVTEDGFAFIAFEYHRGMDLEALVAAFGPLEPERAVHLFAQACHGLAAAHRTGIVHRDVKPANLHCSDRKHEEDSVHLLDFGVARPMDEVGVTLDGTVVGTPAYMSPEAFEGGPITAATDVYSLGAALYFALTGTPPFDGESASDLRRAHQLAPLVPPSLRARLELPRALEKIVLRCLAKDPVARYPDAAGLGAALDGVARQLPPWTRAEAARWWHRARVGRPVMPPLTRDRTTEVEVVTRA